MTKEKAIKSVCEYCGQVESRLCAAIKELPDDVDIIGGIPDFVGHEITDPVIMIWGMNGLPSGIVKVDWCGGYFRKSVNINGVDIVWLENGV